MNLGISDLVTETALKTTFILKIPLVKVTLVLLTNPLHQDLTPKQSVLKYLILIMITTVIWMYILPMQTERRIFMKINRLISIKNTAITGSKFFYKVQFQTETPLELKLNLLHPKENISGITLGSAF